MQCLSGWLLALLLLGGGTTRTPHAELERHLQKARADLEAGAHEDALVAAAVGLEYDPEHVELLDLASQAATALERKDEAIWYAYLALDLIADDESEGERAAALRRRIGQLDLTTEGGSSLLTQVDDYSKQLFDLARSCASRKFYVNAVDLFLKCRGTRYERRADIELDRIYSNSAARTALLTSGADLPALPLSRLKARSNAARDARHAEWENCYRKESTNYNIETNMGVEMLDDIHESMEQMNKFYRKIFSVKGRTRRCGIRVYASRRDFDHNENRTISPSVRGFFVPGEVRVATYDPATDGRRTKDLWSTLFHEASHQFTREISDGTVPGWLNEGTACYFEGARILPNRQVETNLIPHGRLRHLRQVLDEGRPSLRTVIAYQQPGSYPGSYYPVGWGLVYFMQNYENEKCERPYVKAYQDFLKSYRRDAKGDPAKRFEEYFVKKAKQDGIETLNDFQDLWERWMIDLHDMYFGPAELSQRWVELARKRRDCKKKDEALEAYRYALRKDPESILASFEMADLYASMRRKPEAILAYSHVIRHARKLEPDAEVAGFPQQDASDVIEDCFKLLKRLDSRFAEGLQQAYGGFARTAAQAAERYADAEYPRTALQILQDAIILLEGERDLEELRQEILELWQVEIGRWRRLVTDGLEGWQRPGPSWEPGENGILASSGGMERLLHSEQFQDRYRIEATVKPTRLGDDGMVGLIFGSNRNTGMQIGGVLGFGIAITFQFDDEGLGHPEPLERVKLTPGQDIHLAVEVQDQMADFFVNGELVGTERYRPEELRGQIGLLIQDAEVEFTELRIRS